MTAKDVLDILVPSPDASPAAIARWRWFQGLATTLLIFSTACLYIITAKASDLDEVRAAIVVPSMEQIHKRYCLSSNQETRQILRLQVVALQRDYQEATGIQYPLEDCDEIRKQSAT